MSCTLHALLASHSPAAVIFRRGPSKQTALIAWDRSDDTFTVGQWFKGRVYPDRSDLSPDGEHLLTFMGSFRPPFYTWTALSRPPFFTALALWPLGHTWGGGGTFLGEREIVLHHGSETPLLAPGFVVPKGLKVLPPGPATEMRVKQTNELNPHPLRSQEREKGIPFRQERDGVRLVASWQATVPDKSWPVELRFSLRLKQREVMLDGASWADLDRQGDLLFAVGRRLYRCRAAALPDMTSSDEVVTCAKLLADFTDLAFRPLPAPYATPRESSPAARPAEGGGGPVLDRATKEDRRERARLRRASRAQANRTR